MANTILVIPPQGLPAFDPKTGKIDIVWANFFNSLAEALRAGTTFGPAAPASVTILNGIVTEAS